MGPELEEMIEAARGEKPCDLLLKNGRIVNVFTEEIHEGNVAIYKGRIAGIGDYKAKEIIDLKGIYICPGFFDGHVHIESAMVPPPEYARAVVPLGTTTVIIDPHEIANVLGLEGIKYMLETSNNLPLNVFIMLSSCVPATDMETSGARLSAFDLKLLLDEKSILGLGELMNYPGVVHTAPEVMEKIRAAGDKLIDGHAPRLMGKELNAYIAAGIKSDHECTTLEEARGKMRMGMHIMIREGTTVKNLKSLLPLVKHQTIGRCSSRKTFFVTDDRHPYDLLREGHINFMVKTAIKSGVDPVTAIQMATINGAEYFKLGDLGAIAPGYRADIVAFDNFDDFNILSVYKDGQLVASDRKMLPGMIKPVSVPLRSTVNTAWIEKEDFVVKAMGKFIKIIEVVPDQLITKKRIEEAKIVKGRTISDPERDILKVAVIERHLASGNTGLGFVKGIGLKSGAIASSVAHDSHNIVVVGTNDEDMYSAAVKIVKLQGGQVVVENGKVVEELPLPIAGLMTERKLEEVENKIEALNSACQRLGATAKDPFMVLSFLALPVIPEIRVSDKGIIDVVKFQLVPLFEET